MRQAGAAWDVAATGALPAAQLAVLKDIAIAVEAHLAYEEALMREAGYALMTWHKMQHASIRRRLHGCIDLLASGDCEALFPFLEHLDKWLRDHTAVADRMMTASLRNHQRVQAT
jgi:hemerythrin-like metal-binding protein